MARGPVKQPRHEPKLPSFSSPKAAAIWVKGIGKNGLPPDKVALFHEFAKATGSADETMRHDLGHGVELVRTPKGMFSIIHTKKGFFGGEKKIVHTFNANGSRYNPK